MEPETLARWFPVFRDFLIVICAVFMLSYETVVVAHPSEVVIGAAGMLLVSPAAFRLDAWRRNGKSHDE